MGSGAGIGSGGSKIYGGMVREARERAGLSQVRAAVAADCHRTMLLRIETGERMPGRELAVRLAEVLAPTMRERVGMMVAAGFWPGAVDADNVEAAMDLEAEVAADLGWGLLQTLDNRGRGR